MVKLKSRHRFDRDHSILLIRKDVKSSDKTQPIQNQDSHTAHGGRFHSVS